MEHGYLRHISGSVDQSIASGVGASDRINLQWSVQETRDLLMIRAVLDQSFMETKRNKLLWEETSRKMMDRGYSRSAEQCKAKWKNLVTRYKGCETMEDDVMKQQFPFYNDLQSIFQARLQKMLWMETEGQASGSKKRLTQLSSDDDDDNEGSGLEKITSSYKTNKKKAIKSSIGNNPSGSTSSNLKEILEEFMKQQVQIEMQWMKTFEAKEEERRLTEIEWRQKMESLENERIMLERRWREREEQRMMREEERSERRDRLINELYTKLKREGM